MPKSNLPQLKWNIIIFAIASLAIIVDQITKWLIQSHLSPGQSVPETGFFRLTYAQNTGAAFSIFWGKSDILTVITICGTILLLLYVFVGYRRYPFLDVRLNRIAVGLILGGNLGNLIDRIRVGHVRDFLDVGPWPIFNVADSCIVVGVILMAFSILLISYHVNDEHHQ
jgi:signal peptidase II